MPAGSPAPPPPSKRPPPKRRVLAEQDDQDDESTLAPLKPAASRAKPASKGKSRAVEVTDEEDALPRRRSGRLNGKAEDAPPSPSPAVASLSKPSSRRTAVVVAAPEQEVEDEEMDEVDEQVELEEQELDRQTSNNGASLPLPSPAVATVPAPSTAISSSPSYPKDVKTSSQPRSPSSSSPTPTLSHPNPPLRSQPTPPSAPPPPSGWSSSFLAYDPSRFSALSTSRPLPPPLTDFSLRLPGPQKRLIISRMVLENFKSYAGRQHIGPFHKSFSAIVGPNGSGKSNTIDALLFVFGYRANKMRQGKLSELIHNSEAWPGLEYCKVEVWFEEIIDLVRFSFLAPPPHSIHIPCLSHTS